MLPHGFFKSVLCLPMVAASLSLAACAAPGAVPHGYTHHAKPYKSPPAARPQPIGYPYSEQQNAESAAHWRIAAQEMVARLSAKHGVPPAAVHVLPAMPATPFHASFDNFLREALVDHGYRLTANPTSSTPLLRYDALIVSHESDRDTTNPRPDSPYQDKRSAMSAPAPLLPATRTEVVLTLTAMAGDVIVGEETGVYYVPDADLFQYREPRLKLHRVVSGY